ncbi:putative receptor-like protein kinase [Zea mays]|uniref:Putative receptor-like protein kinase n=1 Tax=Zea mays TaxID=4577 RepID=A0A1D6GMT2_MAIZE|nr:putative receptor-like protein kinase [Zea mays]
MEAFCAEEGGRLLTAAVAPRLRAGDPPRGMVDERAAACVGENPSLRPSMADVVRTLEQSAQGSISAVGMASDGHWKV